MERREFSCNYCIFSGDFQTITQHSIQNHPNKLLNVRQRVVSPEDQSTKTKILRYGIIPANIPKTGYSIHVDATGLQVFVKSTDRIHQESALSSIDDYQRGQTEGCVGLKRKIKSSAKNVNWTENITCRSNNNVSRKLDFSPGIAKEKDLIYYDQAASFDIKDCMDEVNTFPGPVCGYNENMDNFVPQVIETLSDSTEAVEQSSKMDITDPEHFSREIGVTDNQDIEKMKKLENQSVTLLYARSDRDDMDDVAMVTDSTRPNSISDIDDSVIRVVENTESEVTLRSESDSYETANEKTGSETSDEMIDFYEELFDLQELDHFLAVATYNLESQNFGEARKMALNAYKKLEGLERNQEASTFPFAEYYLKCMEVFLVLDIFQALKCFYKDVLLAEVDGDMFGPKYYPIHVQQVMVYWKQILDGKFHLKIILRYMADLTEMAHQYTLRDKTKASRVFHLCSDLSITYRSLKRSYPTCTDIDAGIVAVAIESALVLMILGDHYGVKMTCKGALELCGYESPELLEIWARSLQMTKRYSVAIKKAEQALTCSKISQDRIKAIKKLISQLQNQITVETEAEESNVNSDNEWLTDTNVPVIKQQRDQVENMKSKNKHEKKKRGRPKRQEMDHSRMSESQDSFVHSQYMTWNDIGKSEGTTHPNTSNPDHWLLTAMSRRNKRRRRNTSGQSTASSNSNGNINNNKKMEVDVEEDFPGYDGSDLETDNDFDSINMDDVQSSGFISDTSSSDNFVVDIEDDHTMYEKSCRRYSEDAEMEDDIKVEENELLQNGLDLSPEFVNKFHSKRSDNFYRTLLSEKELIKVCRENPSKFKKCTIHIESSHGAVATVIEPMDDVQEIEISGRSKCGHNIFTEDEVVVEILKTEKPEGKGIIPRFNPNYAEKLHEVKSYGKVIGRLGRQRFDKVDHPILVCILDDFQMDLMKPLCKTIPKLHILNNHTESKFEIEIYDYDDTSGELQYRERKLIDPAHKKGFVFLVAYLKWDVNTIYPLGAVVDILKSDGDIGNGMKILRLQHQVPYMYRYSTVRSVQSMICRMPLEPQQTLTQGRLDLTEILTTFTIDPAKSKDLDDALSIEKVRDGIFRIGVHIADVTSYVQKDDHVDREARERAVTFYPGQGYKPYHMLPEPLSQNLCSLLPGKKRLALTVFFLVDENGDQKGHPDIKRTVIKSSYKLNYEEVQDVIMEKSSDLDQKMVNDIQQLYTIARSMRKRRLGNAMFALPVEVKELDSEESVLETLEAHYLVEEFMVLANFTVANLLMKCFPKCVPLRCQNAPPKEAVQKWLNSYKDIADIILHLQGIKPLEHRTLKVSNVPPKRYTRLAMLQEKVWKKLGTEIERNNFRQSWKLIGCDEIHPLQSLSYIEWIRFQETAMYKCSGKLKDFKREGRHFSLGMYPYCHFTSPIRRYTDVIVHRLLHSAIDKKESPYKKQEVDQLCAHINAVSKRAKSYQKQCKAIILGHKLKKEPVMFHGFAKDFTDKSVTFHIPGMRTLPKNCKELPCNLLNLCSRPIIKKEADSFQEFLTLKWQRRVYSHTGYAPWTHRQNQGCKRIDPHQRAAFIRYAKWIEILNAMFEGSIQKLKSILKDDPNVLKEYIPQCRGTVKDVTSEVRDGNIIKQNCDFSLSVTQGQVMCIQITAEPLKGILVPIPQMFDVSRSFKCCLQHVRDPVSHFANYSTSHSKPKYTSATDYMQTWMPLVTMEAAVSAVRSDSAYINDLPVKFEQRSGRFTLRISSFCEPRNIDFNSMSMEFMLKGEEEEEEVQYVASSDYLCIRCVIDADKNPVMPTDSSQILNNGGRVWLAHAEVDQIKKRKKADKVDVHFRIHKNSPDALQKLITAEKNPRCCVEVLQKSEDLRRTEAILNWLDKATPLAKSIALGRKCPKLDKDHLDLARKIEGDLNVKGLAFNNTQQHKAIQKALVSSFSVIQGPPGTGKTYTGIKLLYLFNKINKIWNEEGNKRMQILFCGPSNKSVDLVAKWMIRKLGDLSPKIVRMYGSSMEQVEYPIPGKTISASRSLRDSKPDPELADISMHHLIRENGKPHAEEITNFDKKFRENPDFSDYEQIKEYLNLVSQAVQEELKHYDIIFCTTAMAANPKFLKGTKGRIYQVIIDECGMCTEPESLVPIVATQAHQVVLIGDHKQLRPVVLCKDAAELGLEKSLFERYAEKATFLNMQYRMNPRICDFPSQRFYSGRLQTAPSSAWEVFQPLSIWIYPEIPHIFCNIEGEENKLPVSTEEGNENSCRNEEEVQQLVKVFKHLVNKEGVNPSYINVVSQYNAQCCALRDALKKERYTDFNVNTVVASQGGEWDYVIFSTVRSLPDYKIEPTPTLGWCKENLGFITDEHQVNVALTRSRKGLIIIGNRNLLKCDKVWRALLEHYDKAGCIVEAKDFPRLKKNRRKNNQKLNRETSREFYHGTDMEYDSRVLE